MAVRHGGTRRTSPVKRQPENRRYTSSGLPRRIARFATLGAFLLAALAWQGAASATSAPRQEARIAPAPCAVATARQRHLAGCVIQTGTASWYGEEHHGLPTANGEIFNMHMLTAAHATLPMNALVRVICLRTGRSVVVRINDRGPFVRGRVIDLTPAGAHALGFDGLAPVTLAVVGRNA